MTRRHRLFAIGATLAASLAIAACSSAPQTSSQAMRGYASEVQSQVDLKKSLARDTDRADKLIARGQRNVDTGQRRIKEGEKLVKQGNKEVADGTKLKQDSERRFREAFPDLRLP